MQLRENVNTDLSAKLGNRWYEDMVVTGRLGAGREGSVTTLDGVEEVDDVTGVVSAGGGEAGAERLRTQECIQ